MNIQASQILKNVLGKQAPGKTKTFLEKLSSAINKTIDKESKTDRFDIESVLMEYLDPTAGMSEDEKKAYEERIMQKLRAGKKLTAEEMNYLRAKNPQLYAQAARVQAMRENLENQLKNCRSKEEVEKVYGNAISMVAKDDPMKEAIVAAYDDVMKEFKKTEQYQALPEKEEDAETTGTTYGGSDIKEKSGNNVCVENT
ncbi:hypothetical protein [Roseburia sp. 499]|uniref:hypothetical protein n=1 Tax=Roseburia sp. 499 TaxID=1261634 RepID=UPI000950DE66|nr:hypothetical protein [Roseburia sp. 499]WVK70371.1 hypothetical protein BIV20_02245 [Roseburia sp. 499]